MLMWLMNIDFAGGGGAATAVDTWFDEQQGKIIGTRSVNFPGLAGRGRKY